MHFFQNRDVRQTLSEQSIRSDSSSPSSGVEALIVGRGGRRGHARSASAEILQQVQLSVKKKYFVLGAILILIGWLCFVQGIEAVQQSAFLSHVGSGLWGGIAIFVAGLTSLILSVHSCATSRNASKAHIKWLRYTLQACIAFSVLVFVFSLFALFGDAGMLYNDDEEVASDSHVAIAVGAQTASHEHAPHGTDPAGSVHDHSQHEIVPPLPVRLPPPAHPPLHAYSPGTLTTGKARRMIIDVLLILCSLIAIACSHSLHKRATKDLNELRRLPSMFLTDNVSGITSISATRSTTSSGANMLLPVTMTTFGMFNHNNNTGSPIESDDSGMRSLGAIPSGGVSAAPPSASARYANNNSSNWSRHNVTKAPIKWQHPPTYDEVVELSDYSSASRSSAATTTVMNEDVSSTAQRLFINSNNDSFMPSFQRLAVSGHLNRFRNTIRKSLRR